MTATASAPPPDCDIAFKEWAGVRDALISGRQTVILRKGGIAEGPGGFVPEHRVFWIYPTWTHQSAQGMLDPVESQPPEPGFVAIDTLAVVERLARIEREGDLDALAPYHRLRPETVLQRFHYRSPGLWLLQVRVYRRAEPIRLAVTPDHEGCKTWVPLHEAIPTDGLIAVLDDPHALEQQRMLSEALPIHQPMP